MLDLMLATGKPVFIRCTSVEESEELWTLLERHGFHILHPIRQKDRFFREAHSKYEDGNVVYRFRPGREFVEWAWCYDGYWRHATVYSVSDIRPAADLGDISGEAFDIASLFGGELNA